MSPIKGLTTDEPAFPRIGVLRKGGPKTDPKKPGPDLTYFRFTSEYPEVEARFHAIFGDKPTAIPVILPYRTRAENFDNWREEWVAGGLKHRCDGETCTVWQDEDGTYQHTPKPCPGGCKPVGRLTVILPDFGRLAHVTALTTSDNDIRELNRNLAGLESILGGDLRSTPLVLRRAPRMVSTPEVHPKGHPQQYQPTGKRVRREKWLLTIEADEDWTQLRFQSWKQAALAKLATPAALPMLVDQLAGEILDGGETFAAPDSQDYDEGDEAEQEIQDGQFTELVEEVHGNDNRPLAAEAIRSLVRYRAGWTNKQTKRVPGAESSDDQKSYVDSLLSQAIKPEEGVQSHKDRDNIKSAVLDYIIGVTDVEDLISKEAGAILDWLIHPDKDNKGLSPWARKEVAAIHTAWLKTQGQQELPL